MQAAVVDQLVGQTIGRYRIERLLGRDRFGTVYLAQDSVANALVVLTMFDIPERLSAPARQRFRLRFREKTPVLARLKHPHILPIDDAGEQFGKLYLVTPYMTSRSLAARLKQEGRCSVSMVAQMLSQVAEGLDYVHANQVIHGTLKPANILLTEKQTWLVAGFGLMDLLQASGLEEQQRPNEHLMSIADTLLVAPAYIAPEVVKGQAIDARSDVYALGCILFEALSGRPPFGGGRAADSMNAMEIMQQHVRQAVPSLREVSPDLPIALTSVLRQALEQNPAHRFQRVSELAEAFLQVSGVAASTLQRAPVEPPSATTLRQAPLVVPQSDAPPPISQPLVTASPLPPVPGSNANRDAGLPAQPSESAAWWLPSSAAAQESPYAWPAQIESAPRPLAQSGNPRRSPASKHARGKKKATGGMSRRKAVALVATGGVLAAGAFLAVNTGLMNTLNHQGAQTAMKGATPAIPPVNAAVDYTNPANGNPSLLIHLPNGSLVAYEKACTHKGVFINYDPATHLLVCPAHGAMFDPARDAAVVQGPATQPQPRVKVQVRSDGSITMA